jgi:hypothetical protein
VRFENLTYSIPIFCAFDNTPGKGPDKIYSAGPKVNIVYKTVDKGENSWYNAGS